MRNFVRHSLTWMALASYAVLTVVGTGWHALIHQHAAPSLATSEEESVQDEHSHCCHFHRSTDDDTCPAEEDDREHNHPEHDDDSCLVCQIVAQAQANVDVPVVDSDAEIVRSAVSLSDSQIARWLPAAYDSRGPPA